MRKAKVKFRGGLYLEEIHVNQAEGTAEVKGQCFPVNKISWEAPVSGTIYGVALNYKGALAALGDAVHEAPYKEAPKAPILYIKPMNTVIGYGMPIPLPINVPELEMGASLGIVIGRTATHVQEDQAWEHISGFTIVNDVSIPHASVYRPAVSQKCRDGFCPIGPWVMLRDEVAHPDSLRVRVYINDHLQQENSTENLIRPISRLIADITEFMTLHQGDILLVGVPEGAPKAKAGDVVRIEIEGIGSLENTIVLENECIAGVTL